MDRFDLALKNLTRLAAHPLKVERFSYLAQNFHNSKAVYQSLDFSFALSGPEEQFTLVKEKTKYKIPFPCVYIKLPDCYYETHASSPWEEFYITYSKDMVHSFNDFGIDLSQPVWPFKISTSISRQIKTIIDVSKNVHEVGVVDKLDRLCEQLICDAYVTAKHAATSSGEYEGIVRKIASYIEFHYLEEISISNLVRKYGLTERTFLRQWLKLFNLPPSRYISLLKIEEAKRLLLDTKMRVNEIAAKLNFDDSYYFSRKFKLETGLSPKLFRQQHTIQIDQAE